MDPTQALIDLLRGIDTENREQSVFAAEALADWLQGGGFFPMLRKSIERAQISGVEVFDARGKSEPACMHCGRKLEYLASHSAWQPCPYCR